MDAVAQQPRISGMHELRGMRVRLNGTRQENPPAAGQQPAHERARIGGIQLRIADEVDAQRDKFLRNRADERIREHIQRALLHPHGRGGVQMVELLQEMRIAEEIGLRQALMHIGQDALAPAIAGNGQRDRAAVGKRLADGLHQRADHLLTRAGAGARAVVAVEHGEVGGEADDRVGGVDARGIKIIAGEEERMLPLAQAEPCAAGAMAAAAPGDGQAAGQLCRRIGQAEPLQHDRIVDREGELARRLRRHDDAARKPARKQRRQRAGLVFMGMGQKKITAGANLLRRQMGKLVALVAALIAAIHNERNTVALDEVTVPLLGTGFSRQIKLHARASLWHASQLYTVFLV